LEKEFIVTKNIKGKRPQRSRVASANPRSYSELLKQETESGITPAAPVAAKPAPAEPVSISSSKVVDWQHEYAQVFSDLRQLLLISGALILLMIVLGFLI
jgi:hypothetical protein